MSKVTIFIGCITSVACVVEWYKKGLRGYSTEEGTKTRASVIEVSVFAFVVSLLMALSFCTFVSVLSPLCVAGVTVSIFGLQYFVDLTVVKTVVNAVIKNVAGSEKCGIK